MTGIGRAEASLGKNQPRLKVEIRTLNHKYLELSIRLPTLLSHLETDIREIVKNRISRGYIQMSVSLDGESPLSLLSLDHDLLKNYLALIDEIRKRYDATGPVDINILLQLPGVVKMDRTEQVITAAGVKTVVSQSLDRLITMREAEGKHLAHDMIKRVQQIERRISLIKRRIPKSTVEKRKRLSEIIKGLERKPNSSQIIEEIASFVGKFDIAEECVRLRSHCQLFNHTLRERAASGRKLNFILQEMLKETNTISSKAADTFISHQAVEMKEEIERLREQVQNIE
jgi:uncharacterized protein (TIGR00255 family)